jgi:tetratricopeptide (TPR) repeat protein
MRLVAAAVFILMFAGCGSTPKKATEPPRDRELNAAVRTARYAFEHGNYREAAGIYRTALTRAYIRNDSEAILDIRYNLAVCLLELGKLKEALELVQQARADLAASGERIPSDLRLLEATVLYREDRLNRSWKVTESILSPAGDASSLVRAKTHFLRGLIADSRGELSALRESIKRMGQSGNVAMRSDRAELRGRAAMAEERWEQAARYLDAAASLRRQSRDYRRMAISLALAAEASRRAGQERQAASLFLQAGRSAAMRGSRSSARMWLTQAARLFDRLGDGEMAAAARGILDSPANGPESEEGAEPFGKKTPLRSGTPSEREAPGTGSR